MTDRDGTIKPEFGSLLAEDVVYPALRCRVNMMRIEDGETRYFSYLLRTWRDVSGDSDVWVYEMECIQTGQKLTFKDLQSLYDYLKEQEVT